MGEIEKELEKTKKWANSLASWHKDLKGQLKKQIDINTVLARKEFKTLEEVKREYIEFVIDACGGKKTKAALILGVNRRTLYRRKKPHE